MDNRINGRVMYENHMTAVKHYVQYLLVNPALETHRTVTETWKTVYAYYLLTACYFRRGTIEQEIACYAQTKAYK